MATGMKSGSFIFLEKPSSRLGLAGSPSSELPSTKWMDGDWLSMLYYCPCGVAYTRARIFLLK
eukprot:7482902-Pyramimonas_sp.AAC.1